MISKTYRPGHLFLTLLVLTLALVLTACGGDSATTAPDATVVSTTEAAVTTVNVSTVSSVTPSVATTTVGTTSTVSATTSQTNSTTTAAVTGASSTTSATTSGGLTLKKAVAAADPLVKAWKGDAVYVSIFIPEDDKVGMDGSGRAQQWFLETISPGGFQHAFWLVKSGGGGPAVSKATEDTLSKDRGQNAVDRQLPPIASLIDTDRLMEVARQNGGDKSDRPVGTRLARSTKEGEVLAFDLLFYKGEDVVRLRIDAQSGKPVENVKG